MQIGQIIQALGAFGVEAALIRHVQPFHIATNMMLLLAESTRKMMAGGQHAPTSNRRAG